MLFLDDLPRSAVVADERAGVHSADVQRQDEHLPDAFVLEEAPPLVPHRPGRDAGGRGVRYMEWVWDADPNDTEVNYEFILALKEGDELTVTLTLRDGV